MGLAVEWGNSPLMDKADTLKAWYALTKGLWRKRVLAE